MLRHPGEILKTRREILVAGMAGAFGLALEACSGATTKAASTIKPAGSDLGAVEHVVFLMNENRSFDHYYGTYAGVRGFDDPTAIAGRVLPVMAEGRRRRAQRRPTLLPFHLDTATDRRRMHLRPVPRVERPAHVLERRGRWTSFVTTHTSSQFEGPDNGVLTMGYYTRQDLPFWYALADAFTICDNYHCSVFGPTHPNRLYAWSGTLDPAGERRRPSARHQQQAERHRKRHVALHARGARVQGRVVEGVQPARRRTTSRRARCPSPSATTSCCTSSTTSRTRPHRCTRRPSGPPSRADFHRDIAKDELPSVLWVIPPVGYDEHPPSPPAAGQWFVNQT